MASLGQMGQTAKTLATTYAKTEWDINLFVLVQICNQTWWKLDLICEKVAENISQWHKHEIASSGDKLTVIFSQWMSENEFWFYFDCWVLINHIRAASGKRQSHSSFLCRLIWADIWADGVQRSQVGELGGRRRTHPVQHFCPALHGDALKHRQHGEQEVVKVGDATVGSMPAFPALGAVDGALAPVPRDRTRRRLVVDHICRKRGKK